MDVQEIISCLTELKTREPNANKADVERYLMATGAFRKERSVYVANSFAIRVSEANTGSFSNVVLSLSALQKYDHLSVIICIVRPDILDFRITNTTFLKKISHSSLTLRVDNVRGSFLGHDIMDDYEGIPNRPDYFAYLYAAHGEFTWSENLERLVGTTNAIAAKLTRFDPTNAQVDTILDAPRRAAEAQATQSYKDAEAKLLSIIVQNHNALLAAASINNVNIRGNRIESIITGAGNEHRIDDMLFPLDRAETLVVDVKTKLMDRASAPKAYNVDKALRLLSQPDRVFTLFFVGLDQTNGSITGRLVSIFDPVVLAATRVQHHWAGRASRGVTQLTGDLGRLFAPTYQPSVSIIEASSFLRSLIER